MNDLVRQKLRELMVTYGYEICDDRLRCEGLLRDYCGEHKSEIFVLVTAITEQVPKELLDSQGTVPVETLIARLMKRIQEDTLIAEPSARWCVESWAFALGIIAETDCTTVSRSDTQSMPIPNFDDQFSADSPEEQLRNSILEALADGIITSEESLFLRQARERLGIPTDRASQILAEVRANMQKGSSSGQGTIESVRDGSENYKESESAQSTKPDNMNVSLAPAPQADRQAPLIPPHATGPKKVAKQPPLSSAALSPVVGVAGSIPRKKHKRSMRLLVAAILIVVALGATVGVLVLKGSFFGIGTSNSRGEFVSSNLPTKPGVEYIYYEASDPNANGPRAPIPVSFTLDGPWDFTQRLPDQKATHTLVDPKDAPDSADFPDSDTCTRSDSNYYLFSRLSDASLLLLGSSNHGKQYAEGVRALNTNNPPELLYRFPFKVGDSWESQWDSVVQDYSDVGFHCTSRTKVMANNRIKVPSGNYDSCYILQTTKNYLPFGNPNGSETQYSELEYTWIVANVGVVAHIASYQNEPNEVFSEAADYASLKEISK